MGKVKNNLPAASGKAELTAEEKELFDGIREVLAVARGKAFAAVNFAMVEAYWNIGRIIVEKQGGEERAAYGDGLIVRMSKELTAEFGKGFTAANLKNMRQFYFTFQKPDDSSAEYRGNQRTRYLEFICLHSRKSDKLYRSHGA